MTLSNLRAAYAEASTTYLTDNTTPISKTITVKGISDTDTFAAALGELSFSVSDSGDLLDKGDCDVDVSFAFDSAGTCSATVTAHSGS